MRRYLRIGSETIFRHKLFELRRERLASDERPDEAGREALVLEAPHWVNVVAIDTAGAVLLVHQWRFGIGAPTLEIPGGMVDPGESPRAAAERELYEETGHRAARWSLLGEVEPNPAFLSNRCTTFLAEGLERIGDPPGDGEEEIAVVRRPLADIPALVAAGEIRHALVIAAFYLHDRRR